MKYLLPTLILLTALSIALSAAFFSVTGLASLFAGASLAVMIMAGTLEVGKLVIASLLHQYWNDMNTILKVYLTLATAVLMVITSAGIYGFLSNGYSKTSNQLEVIEKQTQVLEMKKERFTSQVNLLEVEKESLNSSINELTRGLSNNVIQYTDANGNVVTTTSSATRRALTEQLEDNKIQREKLDLKLEAYTDSISNIDNQIYQIESEAVIAGELGPLKYISKLTGKSMDVIVNWFMLLLIFVFDPLAVSLIIAANFAFSLALRKKDSIPLEEQVESMRNVVESYDDLQEEIDNFVQQETLTEEEPQDEISDSKQLELWDGIEETEETEEEIEEEDEEEIDPPTPELVEAAKKYKESMKDKFGRFFIMPRKNS